MCELVVSGLYFVDIAKSNSWSNSGHSLIPAGASRQQSLRSMCEFGTIRLSRDYGLDHAVVSFAKQNEYANVRIAAEVENPQMAAA
jgi:hypothetical protein